MPYRFKYFINMVLIPIQANIQLPDSRPESPMSDSDLIDVSSSEDSVSYEIVEHYRPADQSWGYNYESSFRREKDRLKFLENSLTVDDNISTKCGFIWAIPEDGRTPLMLSFKGLSFMVPNLDLTSQTKEAYSQDQIESETLGIIENVLTFNKHLHRSKNRSFWIFDFDPWNIKSITYKSSKLNFHSRFESARQQSWRDGAWGSFTWDNQESELV